MILRSFLSDLDVIANMALTIAERCSWYMNMRTTPSRSVRVSSRFRYSTKLSIPLMGSNVRTRPPSAG